jgi:hypothetical protein
MEHPKAIGDRSALAIMLALQEAGHTIFLPFGENSRCDLAIDIDDRLVRVQCKTGRLRQGAVRFKVSSCDAHHRRPPAVTRDYLGEIDYFAVYCPETEGVYLIPIEDIKLTRKGVLRVDSPRNGQRRRIRFAARYEIGNVSVRATEAPGASAGGSAPCA